MALSPENLAPAHRPANYYSYVLRCIGQSLEGAELKSLELKTQGDTFIVQGWSKKTFGTMDFENRYSREDIERLDAQGRTQRRTQSAPPNLLSLPQVLRFCGSYVDRLRGRLTRVSWQDQSDKIQSITIQFEPWEENQSSNLDQRLKTIEELCIHVYKQRKKITSSVEKILHRPSSSVFNDF